jgi:two-component system chemotaxis response regulator CheB
MKQIKDNGGTTIVQDPGTAQNRVMPEAAISICEVDHILPLEGIGELLAKLS